MNFTFVKENTFTFQIAYNMTSAEKVEKYEYRLIFVLMQRNLRREELKILTFPEHSATSDFPSRLSRKSTIVHTTCTLWSTFIIIGWRYHIKM